MKHQKPNSLILGASDKLVGVCSKWSPVVGQVYVLILSSLLIHLDCLSNY